MKERPTHWEVVCKTCLSGLVMSDSEVEKRLHGEARNWPKHCGRTMMLRRILTPQDESQVCSNAGCMGASFGICSCSCGGRYHGVNNPNPQFNRISVKPKQWYQLPIVKYIGLPPKSN